MAVEGVAGTGKTMPTIEAARRAEWSTVLPLAAITAMKEDPDRHFRLQVQLIADEAQDFFSSGHINFLYRSIVDRLQRGRVTLFGDFARHAVFREADLTQAELKEGWMPDLASLRLCDNCRNRRRAAVLAGIQRA